MIIYVKYKGFNESYQIFPEKDETSIYHYVGSKETWVNSFVYGEDIYTVLDWLIEYIQMSDAEIDFVRFTGKNFIEQETNDIKDYLNGIT